MPTIRRLRALLTKRTHPRIRARAVVSATLAGLMLAVGMLVVGGSPASAAPKLACANAVDIGLTIRQGNYVEGFGKLDQGDERCQ